MKCSIFVDYIPAIWTPLRKEFPRVQTLTVIWPETLMGSQQLSSNLNLVKFFLRAVMSYLEPALEKRWFSIGPGLIQTSFQDKREMDTSEVGISSWQAPP